MITNRDCRTGAPAGQFGGPGELRDRLARLMRRPLAWAGIALVNLSAMTLFLWHQTAFITVSSAGLPRPGAGPATRRTEFRFLPRAGATWT